MTPQDEDHLRLLSIFHAIVAGVGALFSLFPVIHLVIGLMMVSGRLDEGNGAPAPAFVGWIFVGMAIVFIVTGLALSVCLFLAGRYLKRREHYTFCLVMAALSCIFAPFGTVLGVLTIIVLMRESVKEAFGVPTAAAAARPGGGAG